MAGLFLLICACVDWKLQVVEVVSNMIWDPRSTGPSVRHTARPRLCAQQTVHACGSFKQPRVKPESQRQGSADTVDRAAVRKDEDMVPTQALMALPFSTSRTTSSAKISSSCTPRQQRGTQRNRELDKKTLA